MSRLTREQWLEHGLQSLTNSGFTSLKADKLVKTLGVSRGSFYWHFKNLADYHKAVLERWEDVTVKAIIEDIERHEENAIEKLRRLIEMGVNSQRDLERAIRAWSFNDREVRETVSNIDKQRRAYIQNLLEAIGLDRATAETQAHIIYCGCLGQIMLEASFPATHQKILVDELMRIAIQRDVE